MAHPADIRMQVEGETLAELFEAAALGMGEILVPGICMGNRSGEIISEIALSAPDVTALLIDFLSEILTRSCEERIIFCRADFMKIEETTIAAKIYGKKVQKFEEDIKAVTYHEAEVKKDENGKWKTMVIFDI